MHHKIFGFSFLSIFTSLPVADFLCKYFGDGTGQDFVDFWNRVTRRTLYYLMQRTTFCTTLLLLVTNIWSKLELNSMNLSGGGKVGKRTLVHRPRGASTHFIQPFKMHF